MKKYLLIFLSVASVALAAPESISPTQFCTNWEHVGPYKDSTCTVISKGVSIGFAPGTTKENVVEICNVFKAGRASNTMALMKLGSEVHLNYLTYNATGIHGLTVKCKP